MTTVLRSMMDLTIQKAEQGDPRALDPALRILASAGSNSSIMSVAKNNFAKLDPTQQNSFLDELNTRQHGLAAANDLLQQSRLALATVGAGAGLIRPNGYGVAVAIGAALGDAKLQGLQDDFKTQYSTVHGVMDSLRPMTTPPNNPGGATTALTHARLDRGKSPFEPIFGLLYAAH
jgi:hypothetical protein